MAILTVKRVIILIRWLGLVRQSNIINVTLNFTGNSKFPLCDCKIDFMMQKKYILCQRKISSNFLGMLLSKRSSNIIEEAVYIRHGKVMKFPKVA